MAMSLFVAVGVALLPNVDNVKLGDWRYPQSKTPTVTASSTVTAECPRNDHSELVPSANSKAPGIRSRSRPMTHHRSSVPYRTTRISVTSMRARAAETNTRCMYLPGQGTDRARSLAQPDKKIGKRNIPCRRALPIAEVGLEHRMSTSTGATTSSITCSLSRDSRRPGDETHATSMPISRSQEQEFDLLRRRRPRRVHAGPVPALVGPSGEVLVMGDRLSCSGATILTASAFSHSSAREVRSSKSKRPLHRPIDSPPASAGGNDIDLPRFQHLRIELQLPVASASTLPLSRFDSVNEECKPRLGTFRPSTPNSPGVRVHRARYLRQAAPNLADGARVLPMTYPDITRSAVENLSLLDLESDFSWTRSAPQAPNPYLYSPSFGSDRNLSTANER